MEQYKLCYVKGNFAWFTTAPLDKQWGDDWDDAPYEHNAGEPYEYEDYDLIKVAFDGHYYYPEDYHLNSPYNVRGINKGVVPWIETVVDENKLCAGATIREFEKYMMKNEGTVYYSMITLNKLQINETN